MKRLTLRLATAVVTCLLGIAAATALVVHSRTPVFRFDDHLHFVEQPNPHGDTTPGQATLEMVFVLDTTGSMSGLLEGAKQRIWGIVNEVMQQPSRPAVKIGLVAYRDNGDEYVTKVTPLTSDLDQVYSTLMDFQAGGGGDTPENVRRALSEGVHAAGWSKDGEQMARIVFLVGDAPPHDDYTNEPPTTATAAEAVRAGMIVNTIQCGQIPGTREVWQAIARQGEGQFFAIAQDGGVQTITTPYDDQLGKLGQQLGATFLAYGGGGGARGISFRSEVAERQAAAESKIAMRAAAPAKAERALNKTVNAEAYANDLMQSIENKSVTLDAVKDEDLPDDLRKLPKEDRKKEIDQRLAERQKLRAEIVTLSKQRDAYLAAERKKQEGTKQTGFDSAVAAALKAQLARKGIK
ncbi:MAG: VWA domain-containing protein [Pyrinomonadaceae bacterium]|nr:VWA domain-containing protein [Pyrinomonadaceae bacterium]